MPQDDYSDFPDQGDDYSDFPDQGEPSYLQQWENAWINKPLWEGPSKAAHYISDEINEQTMRNAASGRWDAEIGLNNPTFRGLYSGMLEGAGDVLSSFTSPLNLATLGAVKGAGLLARTAPMAGRALGIGGRALSAPVAAGGAAGVYEELTGDEPIDWTRLGMKTAETAGGLAGLAEPIPAGRPRPTALPIEAAPPAPRSAGLHGYEQTTGDISPMWQQPPAPNPFVGPEPPLPNLELPANPLPPPRGEASPTNPVIENEGQPIFSQDGKTVTITHPDQYTINNLRNQGYVSVQGLVNDKGNPIMVRGDVAPLYLTGQRRAPVAERMQSERGSIQLEPDVPREGAMTIPSTGIDTLRQQNLLTPPEGPVQLDPTQTSMAPPARPELPQYPPGPLKAGETYESRLAASREKVRLEREELDSFAGGEDTPDTTGVVARVKKVADSILERVRRPIRGEEGTLDISDVKRQAREMAGRGDEVDDASPRQVENDVREIGETTTVQEARNVRDGWRDIIAQMSDRELNSPTGVHARDMMERSRQRVIEFLDAEEQAAQTAANRQYAQSSIGQQRDLEQINRNRTISEATETLGFWQDELARDRRSGDAGEIAHSERMLEAARTRLDEITEQNPQGETAEQMAARADQTEARHPDQQEYEAFDTRSNQVLATGTEADVLEFMANERRANPSTDLGYRRTTQDPSIHQWEPYEEVDLPPAREWTPPGAVHGPEPPPMFQPYERPNLNELRQATGDLLPPVQEGLQPKGERVKPTPEQVRRLEGSADKHQLARVKEAYETIDAWREENRARRKQGLEPLERPKTVLDDRNWDQTMNSNWQRVPIDPTAPGLTVKKPYNWSNDFDLEYRDPDGLPVGYAHVRQTTSDGLTHRYVPTLAINRERPGIAARAFGAIGNQLTKMNALDTGEGIISQHTARIVADLVRALRDEKGSVSIHNELKPLMTMVTKVLKNLGEKANVMDVWAAMAKHMPGKKIDVKWMGEKTGIGQGESKPFDPIQWTKEKTGWGMGESGKVPKDEINILREALKVPAGATTMLDLSAPGRQGLSMIATPEFWKASVKMFGALHYDTFKKMDAELRSKDIMVKPKDPITGKEGKSIADLIGTKIYSPASEPGPRAEAVASRWLEMGTGKGPISKVWQHTAGYPIRATNRAFLTFLNELNINRTEKLMNLARDMSIKGLETGRAPMPGILGGAHFSGGRNLGFTRKISPEQAMDMNPYHNLVRGKEIADFVNTATGHGPLKTHLLPHKRAEVSLESASDALGMALFSPGLLASRVRMMNPNTYIMATPFVRKQYLKAAMSTAAAWYIAAEMVKKAAGPEAEVGDDPTSADFGKVRIGDARMDLSGGFSQFATAYSRFYVGGSTSSATGQYHRFGTGYQAETQQEMMQRFLTNKLNPIAKFAYDVASASEYKPFHVGDRTMQLFVPLLGQDLWEIAKENPDLLPLMGTASMFGGGTQIYGKGESVGKFIDPESDWNVTGGGLKDVMPWNWNAAPGEERNFPWSEER